MIKKRKCLTSLLVSVFVLGSWSPVVLGDSKSAESEGRVVFKEKDSEDENVPVIDPPEIDVPELIIPDPTDPIVPTKGPIFVIPAHLNFGTLEIGTTNKIYDAFVNKYVDSDEQGQPLPTGESIYLPPMIVVGDARSNGAEWKLDVTASQFTAPNNVMKSAHLIFTPTVYNNSGNKDTSLISADQAISFAESVVIGQESETLMTSKNSQGKGQTAYILDPNYEESVAAATDKRQAYKLTDRVAGAQLFVPIADTKTEERHVSTVTWTIKMDAS